MANEITHIVIVELHRSDEREHFIYLVVHTEKGHKGISWSAAPNLSAAYEIIDRLLHELDPGIATRVIRTGEMSLLLEALDKNL